MSSRKRQKQHNVPSRKRTRLGDISNSSYHKSQADTCIPSSPKCCINQHVPENEHQLESMDTSMYCSENVDFLPITRKQLARMKKFQRLDPGGLFNSLPPEVLHKLFSMLDPESMLSLCLTSTVLISYVQGYVYTSAGLSHILPPLVTNDMDTVSKRSFNLLGMIIKAVTLMDTFKNRLKVAAFFIDKLHPVYLSIYQLLSHKTAYECFGAALNAFVSGWEDCAKTRVYELVKSKSKLIDRTNTVLQAVPGSLPWQETDVRALHREVFLCPVKSDEEYGLWLSLILKPWPLVFQAKLLYLLTAPGDDSGKVYWIESCGCSHLQHTSNDNLDFSELARAMRVLYQNKAWTEDDIVTIFNEITSSTPNGWCLENVAMLLFGCGTSIVKGFLGSKAINGHVNELGTILFFMANCCVSGNVSNDDIDEDIVWYIHILSYVTQLLPTTDNKNKFIADLVGKWQACLLTQFEEYDPISASDEELVDFVQEFHSTVSSLTRLCQSLLQIKIQSLNN
ncbi:F-box only protein 47-like [Halichondria panicea]|uniref:F-box only protein 47-like n=1 Tax=Halichondria panicea TaxID=6063 RepID=UPI00312B7C82